MSGGKSVPVGARGRVQTAAGGRSKRLADQYIKANTSTNNTTDGIVSLSLSQHPTALNTTQPVGSQNHSLTRPS